MKMMIYSAAIVTDLMNNILYVFYDVLILVLGVIKFYWIIYLMDSNYIICRILFHR